MPVADDWLFRFVPLVAGAPSEMIHVDGVLTYAANTGTAPSLDDYVIGGTSGAVGRVVAGSDLGGTNATGTLTLTNVVGLFSNTETLRVLSEVPFDTVGGTPQGFKIGDTLTGPTTESIDVQAIEYNEGPKFLLPGEGSIYGDNLTAGFANNEQIDVSGGATAVALVNGAESDNSALFPTCTVNGTLAVPGTANTNNSEIIHYDAGTLQVPEDAHIGSAATAANGFAQQVEGPVATGSIRLIDSDTSVGAWTDDDGLEFEEVVFWNAQVAGEVFLAGDLIRGITSGKEFRVLDPGVLDDGDNTGKLITAGGQGVLTLAEDLHRILPGDVLGPKIAEVESVVTVLAFGTLNIPGGTRTEQRAQAGVSQGGIYDPADSLLIRRSSNEFFSHVKDTFEELGELDDKPAINGNVADSLYTIKSDNNWSIPSLGFRFLEKGAWQDDGKNNQWTDYAASRALFTGQDITDDGFLATATNPRPMPDAYVEQNGLVLAPFWLEGPFDVIIKTKTTTDVEAITPATAALGQLIDNGDVTWWSRPYGRLYAHFDSSDVAKVAPIVLKNDNDANNDTGQFRYSFNTGGGGAFTVGEEIIGATSGAIGIVFASDTGATGDVDYSLLTTAQFQDAEVITGSVSAKSATTDGAGLSNLVSGYGTDIKTMVVDRRFTGGTTTGVFVIGETVTQAGTGATGFVLEDDSGTIYVQDDTGTFNGTGELTGGVSGATNTPTATADFTTVPKDLGEGTGDNNYAGVTSGDITDASPRSILDVYEWDKFLTNEKSLTIEGGRGLPAGVQGRLYRGFDSTFAEKQEAPYGNFAGGIMFGAEAHFLDKDTLIASDLQNIRVTPIDGLELTPPNLQTAQVSNLQNGWRGSIYRSTGVGSLDILTTEFQIGAGNAAANSVIVVQAGSRSVSPLPSDVPDTGIVKFEDPNNAGKFLRGIYDSVNRATDTFSLQQGIGQDTIGDITSGTALTQGDDCYAAWIEEEATGSVISNSVQFIGNVETIGIARKKGFDDFESAQTFISTGVNYAVNRQPDDVVNLP